MNAKNRKFYKFFMVFPMYINKIGGMGFSEVHSKGTLIITLALHISMRFVALQ